MIELVICGGVAQGLEQSAHNRLVVGSNPTAPTRLWEIRHFADFFINLVGALRKTARKGRYVLIRLRMLIKADGRYVIARIECGGSELILIKVIIGFW